ncbi:RIP-like protein [Stomoxys calcitrans]|uniref:RPA-interacting protein C-terminal domain-containing protein n=1 Tax=Stomoxys calcitrans TaxID=35570 RepID=A0A1I8QF17_STOCA|nr:RIP-like protein [Stomoxys calcitrans]
MSLECPSNPVYNISVEQKLKSKNAAKIRRYGNEKLRDMLREKCIIRAKEARQQCYSQTRIDEDAKSLLSKISISDILRQELAELEHDIELQDAIYNEILDEFNEWFVQEFEDEANYLLEVAESQDLVCPVCQVNNLVAYTTKDQHFNYRCKCNANFLFASDSGSLHSELLARIDAHEKNCLSKLNFYVDPLNSQLEALCDNCDYFCSL